ncbi:uncharacterized protein DUF1524 [Streptomyces sp. Amel2xB2]|uniref:HNH endonuclease family protein n=1 Tax=Streptomyces sp. Amel2xB2 TaxID=1305829 RepID=UPI000DBAC1B3|nr:HNH endonuclease family protein [Streptomyces sp. Amel2xB2]RAJ70316.1 uncharacterized protein DUF1524 [Streptomyces sp. Amel2xB2]
MTAFKSRLALLLPALLLASACTAAATDNQQQTPDAGQGGKRLAAVIERLDVKPAQPSGYDRDKFKLWIDADHDGCDTRKEVLLAEATKKPRQGDDCKLTGGQWTSYYDGKTVTRDRQLDIDHVVPLGEAWASGARDWPDDKRERYANDLGAASSLVAVSLGPNRSKGDRDPAEWMPPAKSASCRYTTDWVSTKARWDLAIDSAEKTKLKQLAAACPGARVNYKHAK